jgi:hypothetical protein
MPAQQPFLLAYLDSMSGSFLLYLIVGFFAAVWVFFKKTGRRIRGVFGRGGGEPPDEQDPEQG